MAEPVFRLLEISVTGAVRILGPRITYYGLEKIPEVGGAVIAINHTSYIDWVPAAIAVYRRRRRLRFMMKAEMLNVKIVGFLMRGSSMIPVDRSAGAGAYAVAVQRLREGELVGVYPEATISRSFELKEFKTGAARMAREAGVPIIPMIVWGAQRIWTKDHERKLLRNRVPITLAVGGPLRRHRKPRPDQRRAAGGDDGIAATGATRLSEPGRPVLGAPAAGRRRAHAARGQAARRSGAGGARTKAG